MPGWLPRSRSTTSAVVAVIAPNQGDDLLARLRVQRVRVAVDRFQQMYGVGPYDLDVEILTPAKHCLLVHDHHGGVNRNRVPVTGQPHREVASDVVNLPLPAAPAPIDRPACLDDMSTGAELLEPPLIAHRVQADSAPFDLHRPYTGRTNQHMVGFTATVHISSQHNPGIVQPGQSMDKRFLAPDTGRLLLHSIADLLPTVVGLDDTMPRALRAGQRLSLLGRGHRQEAFPQRLRPAARLKVLPGGAVRVVRGGHIRLCGLQLLRGLAELLTAVIGEDLYPHRAPPLTMIRRSHHER